MLCSRKAESELAQMSYVTFDGYVLSALLTVLMIGWIYVSGLIAQRRGRSFRN